MNNEARKELPTVITQTVWFIHKTSLEVISAKTTSSEVGDEQVKHSPYIHTYTIILYIKLSKQTIIENT